MTHKKPLEQTTEEPFELIPRRLWSIIVGVFLMASGIWLLSSGTPLDELWGALKGETNPASSVPLVGQSAPDFELKNLAGETIRLSDFKGKPLLLNFWATWCGPCRAEFPDLQSVAVEHKLVIIGINMTTNDTPSQVPAFVAEFGVTFPIVLDETSEVSRAYQVTGLPTSIFIDRDGIVREVRLGAINKAYIEAMLSKL
ncbi:MAG: TlpA family protein disulfide reductase [Anaerolineae bacterium]|nr:TlpA family protein disulfide reductase [Anaerolineae bacterium]